MVLPDRTTLPHLARWIYDFDLALANTTYPAGRFSAIYSAHFFDGFKRGSTVALGLLWAAHLAARPRAARRSPRATAALGLLEGAVPPAHAVGGWLAAGALGHARAHSAQTSPVTPPSEVPQPCPLPVPRPGSCHFGGFAGTVASCAGLKLAPRTLCSQALAGMTSPGAQVSGAELQPGRAGSALRLRRADAKSPAPRPARRYEKVGLCARLSAFAEPWPRWACRPLHARDGAGADAGATTAPESVQVQRSAGSGPQPWPRTLGSTSSSRSSTGQRARRPRSSPRCACPAPHPLPRARSDHARMPGRARPRAPPSARISPSPCPLRPSLAHAT